MKLNLNRKTLLNELSRISRVVSKKNTLPIIENVKFEIRTNGTIVLSATSLEVSTMRKFKIEEQIQEAYQFCINPFDLTNVLKSLRDDEVSFELKEDICVIEHKKGEVVLPTFDAEDFPKMEEDTYTQKITIEASLLGEWLRNAGKFASTDDLRPIICGVNIYVVGEEMGVASSDGFKLFTDNINTQNGNTTSVDGTLNTKAVIPLLDMINEEEKVTVLFGERMLSFHTPNARLSSIKPSGKYPAFKTLIKKKDNPTYISIDKNELLDSVSRAALSARTDTSCLLLSIGSDTMTVTSEDLTFNKKTKEECVCEVNGKGIDIGVKSSALMECLSVIEDGKVKIEMDEPNKAIFFYDEVCPNKIILLMPLRIN